MENRSESKHKIAKWWHLEEGRVRCELCPHRCHLRENALGKCRGRKNSGDVMRSLNFGKVCVSTVDPIEKKPVFHFRPGALLYSIGTFGCNMSCKNCQNYVLAFSGLDEVPGERTTPKKVVYQARKVGADGIAFTFNEPIMWLEFVIETSALAGKRDLFSLVNTNGFVNPEPLEETLKVIHAMNIDVKGFSEKFYQSNCGASLVNVLETCVAARNAGVHLEINYLLIPEINDNRKEIMEFCKWIVENLGEDTPVHFFRFLPFHMLSHIPSQTIEKLNEAYKIARSSGIRFPYYAGVVNDEHQNTFCPGCGNVVIKRQSEQVTQKICVRNNEVSRFCPTYSNIEPKVENGICTNCGEVIPISH